MATAALPTGAADADGLATLAGLTAEVSALRVQAADTAAAVPALQRQVAALTADAERSFLGYGPFETTAFFASLCVAAYTLIPNPTGVQAAHHVSELRVYRQWVAAAAVLAANAGLLAAVVATQVASGSGGRDVAWLAALMLAPWAPLLGAAVRTVRSAEAVRGMMADRGSCHRVTAVLREALLLGHAGLSVRAAGDVLGFADAPPPPPPSPPAAVVAAAAAATGGHPGGRGRHVGGRRRPAPLRLARVAGGWAGRPAGGGLAPPVGRRVGPPRALVEPRRRPRADGAVAVGVGPRVGGARRGAGAEPGGPRRRRAAGAGRGAAHARCD